MTNIFRSLCQEVLDYYEGKEKYNFSHLSSYDRDNAAFDAWQDIRYRINSAIRIHDECHSEGLDSYDNAKIARFYYNKGFDDAYNSVKDYVENTPIPPIHIDASTEVLKELNLIQSKPISLDDRNPESDELDDDGCCWFGSPPSVNQKHWNWDYKHIHSSRGEFEVYFLPATVKCLPTS